MTGNVVDYECACERNGIEAISHEMLVFKFCGKLEEKSVVSESLKNNLGALGSERKMNFN
jgi:hypothetical protein